MPATGSKSFRPLSLSIRLRTDGFSFFVCDVQAPALVRGEHFLTDDTPEATTPDAEAAASTGGAGRLASRLAQALSRKEYFNSQIDQVYVLADGPFCHVPLEHFRRGEAATLYSCAVGATDGVRVGYNILPVLEVAVLYAIPAEVEETILQFYPTARFFASEAMLLERLAIHAPRLAADDGRGAALPLFVSVSEGGPSAPDVLAVYHFAADDPSREAPLLRFANTFCVTTADDALYFILNVWHTLGLDGTTDELLLLGQTSPLLAQLRTALADYVVGLRHVAVGDLFPNVSLAREAEVPLDLMALLLNRL